MMNCIARPQSSAKSHRANSQYKPSYYKWLALCNGATEPCKVFPYNVTQAIARPQNYGRPMLLCLEMGFFFFSFSLFFYFLFVLTLSKLLPPIKWPA